jgi:hypothetical protein
MLGPMVEIVKKFADDTKASQKVATDGESSAARSDRQTNEID